MPQPGTSPEDQQQDRQADRSLDQADSQRAQTEQPLLRIPRRPAHDLRVCFLRLEDHRAGGVDNQFQEDDVNREQQHRPIGEEHRDQGEPGDGDVNREDVRDRLLNVVEDPPPQFDRLNDGGEIILQQHQRSRLAGDVRSPAAHRDADVGRLECRGIVDAVAGHGDDFAIGLEGVHQPQLLFGHDAGKQADVLNAPRQLFVRPLVQLGSADGLIGMAEADLPPDVLRGRGIVSRDHHHPDSGAVALLDCLGDPGPNRVGEPDQAQELEIDRVLLRRQLGLSQFSLGNGEDPQPLTGHRGDGPGELRATGGGEMAEIGDRFRSAFGSDHIAGAVRRPPDMGQRQQFGGQGVLVHQRPVIVLVLGGRQKAIPCLPDRLFHRIKGVSLAGQDREFQRPVESLGQALRTGGRRVIELAVRKQLLDRHLIQRQRPRLVDAQHGRRAQRLDRRHAPRQNPLLGNPPGSQSQKDRQDHGQFLRQRRHRQGDPGQQPVTPGFS